MIKEKFYRDSLWCQKEPDFTDFLKNNAMVCRQTSASYKVTMNRKKFQNK